ncbi:MarR family winged helix-turn-helix transcriptional regulator [Bacillus sp. B1-b2]|uniref:MarR family winged helix-turn-helix transcriptional regulator n=1 Tax=Bacillus sp. B1-b2 TaxID=2653201 RepID=UPI001D0357DA|nr:MarR family winged helix-turn-helix transcriptional regulator [Bacillus sp. B1-b2]
MEKLDRAEYIRESIVFLNRFMFKSMQKYAEEHGVTVPQAKVIFEVFINKEIGVKQLSQNLKMTQSTVSDIVDRLVDRAVLIKTPNPQDKRFVNITVTEKIQKVMSESSPEPLKRVMRETMSLLEPGEQEAVEKGITLLVGAVKEKMEIDGLSNLEELRPHFHDEKSGQK